MDMNSIIAIELIHFVFVLLIAFPHRYHAGGIAGVELSMPPSHIALSGDFHVQIVSTSFPPLIFQLSRLEGNLAQPLYTFPVYPEAEALAKNRTLVTIPCGFFSRGGIYYILVKKQPIGEDSRSDEVEENNYGNDKEEIGKEEDKRSNIDEGKTASLDRDEVEASGGSIGEEEAPDRHQGLNEPTRILEDDEEFIKNAADYKTSKNVVDEAPSRTRQKYVEGSRSGSNRQETSARSRINKKSPKRVEKDDEMITQSLDVRWPMPQLSVTPENIQTYPERTVEAILKFPGVVCPPHNQSPVAAIPEFWLELHYCGHSLLTCDDDEGRNKSKQVLYSEQVRGFPGIRLFTLRCELFGLAGHYALFLRPTAPSQPLPHTAAYIKADWSDQFVFNVHARSIFPCDVHNGGITVLFQYPSCILASGDRVRLFARLRANVASLAPPTSLEYVAEQRVNRGQHSLHFDCDLFTERYVEYCFVYVSQAITGAVADVRMDCVPTLPVADNESGGWGPWSPWTPCSSSCLGGTRTRYRLCDSPPPRYGAKFCEGTAVQTDKCGKGECFYGSVAITDIIAGIPEIQAQVGEYCRCGCVVHLGQAKPKRLLATSSQSCPGRTFWLIQADDNFTIRFKLKKFHLPCGTQWLKIRDGSSLSANLIADLSGNPGSPEIVNSSGSNLLLEFYSDDMSVGTDLCAGGFLAQASQIRSRRRNVTAIPIAQTITVPDLILKLTAVHIAALFFLSGLLIATALLGAQYLFRYRKYHVPQDDDRDSLTGASCSSSLLALPTRATSNATLLSEVISLKRLRTKSNKHSRLRESMDCETVTLAKEETMSVCSTVTLTQKDDTASEEMKTLPNSPEVSDKDSITREKMKFPIRRLSNVSAATLTHVRPENASKSDPGFYSPASSLASTATIRSTNVKETKEKRNRAKLLAGPTNSGGSDFSIVGADLEMDYYDYNVVNAGAAPGSYLGMDPAFLVWIPPLDEDGEILQDAQELEDIKPKCYIDPGSNKESPEEEMLIPKEERFKRVIRIVEKQPLLEKIKRREEAEDHEEKETKVEKLSIIEDEDIKFADEDDENECNIELSYQDSNILASS